MTAPSLQRRYMPSRPLDLAATLRPHMRGAYDPCHRIVGGVHWRTWRTPTGPATLRLAADAGAVHAQAWGSGADEALDRVPALLGADDVGAEIDLPAGVLRDTQRRCAGTRLTRSGQVFEALAAAIIEQLVTGMEAWRCWSQLMRRVGSPAPGPAPTGMQVFPEAGELLRLPDWEWHRVGLDGRRRATLIAAAGVAGRLDQAAAFDATAAYARLVSLPGVGPWTAAEVVQRSHGAPDAVSVGDYHLPNAVGYVFTGRPRSSDDEMLEILEPYRPHRQRVVRVVEACGVRAPRYGPRMAPRDYRAM